MTVSRLSLEAVVLEKAKTAFCVAGSGQCWTICEKSCFLSLAKCNLSRGGKLSNDISDDVH